MMAESTPSDVRALLDRIEQSLCAIRHTQSHVVGARRSVVACVLRRHAQDVVARSVTPTDTTLPPAAHHSSHRDSDTAVQGGGVHAQIPSRYRDAGTTTLTGSTPATVYDALDMLFILRADARDVHHPSARYSGHVAFPGGHVEPGETDTEAVVREVKEEVGLDLSDTARYRLLGRGPSQIVSRPPVERQASTLVVACHVYYQHGDGEALVLDELEVAAAGWAPLTSLVHNGHVAPLGWSQLRPDLASASQPQSRLLDTYPSVHLPMLQPVVVARSRSRAGGDDDLGETESDAIMVASQRFRLWGLTLRIVTDLLMTWGLRDTEVGYDVQGSKL